MQMETTTKQKQLYQNFVTAFRLYKKRKREWQERMEVELAQEEEEIRRKREVLYAEYEWRMNALDINRISHFAPYRVWMERDEYRFETEHDILYAVSFEEENMFEGIPAYWFGLANRTHKSSPNDIKIRATVTCIIEEFFRSNPNILLYLCDTADEQQAMRSRLFLRWFNGYAQQKDYYIRTEMVMDEGTENYVALIVQRAHPQLQVIMDAFDSIIAQFRANKP